MVFDPKYIADHRVICIVKESLVILQTPDGKEKRCNIHNLKPINMSQAFTLAFRTSKKVWHDTEKKWSKVHMGTTLEKEHRDTHCRSQWKKFDGWVESTNTDHPHKPKQQIPPSLTIHAFR